MEVRHSSWDQADFYDELSDNGVGFCNIDQPRIGRSLGPSDKVIGTVGYVRLHGRNYQDWFRENAGRDARYNYLYSDKELQPWLDAIHRIKETSIETYVIANNHFRGKAAVNALQIKSRDFQQKGRSTALLGRDVPSVGRSDHSNQQIPTRQIVLASRVLGFLSSRVLISNHSNRQMRWVVHDIEDVFYNGGGGCEGASLPATNDQASHEICVEDHPLLSRF